ncbi:hypothetical protein [Streptacidiphilus sp. PAMC 29251]
MRYLARPFALGALRRGLSVSQFLGPLGTGALIASSDDPLGALATAEELTGAFRDRWVNDSMTQDEYNDFVLAGRPVAAMSDGRPWPSRRQELGGVFTMRDDHQL